MKKSSEKRLRKLKQVYMGAVLLAISLSVIFIVAGMFYDSLFVSSNSISILGFLILAVLLVALITYLKYHWEKLGKEEFSAFLIREIFGILVVAFIIIIMIQRKWLLFIVTLIFVFAGSFFEDLVLFNLLFKKKKPKLKKNLSSGILYGFLWVHATIYFSKKNFSAIYYTKKLGYLPQAVSYFIIFLYISVVYWLYDYTQFSLLIYLIPIISNLYYLNKYQYAVKESKK